MNNQPPSDRLSATSPGSPPVDYSQSEYMRYMSTRRGRKEQSPIDWDHANAKASGEDVILNEPQPWGARGPGTIPSPRESQSEDSGIQQEVHLRLQAETELWISNLRVDVQDGVLILGGHVRDDRAAQKAQKALHDIRGIRVIVNQLTVS